MEREKPRNTTNNRRNLNDFCDYLLKEEVSMESNWNTLNLTENPSTADY